MSYSLGPLSYKVSMRADPDGGPTLLSTMAKVTPIPRVVLLRQHIGFPVGLQFSIRDWTHRSSKVVQERPSVASRCWQWSVRMYNGIYKSKTPIYDRFMVKYAG